MCTRRSYPRSASWVWSSRESHPDLIAAYERQLPLSLLYFGVTQVLDPAPAPAGLARLRSAETRPDVLHCGAAPIIGGYPVNLLGAGIPPDAFPYLDTFPYVIDEPGTGRTLPVELLPAEHTPEAVVRRMREDGAVCVKLFFEDGWDLRSDWPLLKQDTARRVVREAHRSGMKVLAHANALDMQKLALAAGVDIIAHGLWNWNEYRKEEGLPAGIRGHLDEIRTRGVGFQPTFRVMAGTRAMFDPATLESASLVKVVPAALLDWYRKPQAQWFKRDLEQEDFDSLAPDRIRTMLERPIGRAERAARYLFDSGHPLLLASDHPANPGHGNHPGLSTHLELLHMAKIGVPPGDLLAAATINNARALGVTDRYGTVEAGKVANLLLLRSNPLEDVSAYDEIEWVILRGRPIRRETLAADYER